MIYNGLMVHKYNIFESNMPPELDPRISHNGEPPQLPKDKYEREKKLAFDDMRAAAARKGNPAVGTPGAAGASTPTPIRPAVPASTSTSVAGTSQAGSSPAVVGSSNPSTPQPIASTSSRPATPGAAAANTAAPSTRPPGAVGRPAHGRPPAPGILPLPIPEGTKGVMSLPELKKYVGMDKAKKDAEFAAVSPIQLLIIIIIIVLFHSPCPRAFLFFIGSSDLVHSHKTGSSSGTAFQ